MNLPDEIVGKWIVDPTGGVVGDEAEKQIQDLIQNHLTRLAVRDGGWTVLYRDPSDNTYWELTFPNSEWHGGGPMKLTRLEAPRLRELYPGLDLP
jgi:hypothetical protein